MPQSLGGGCRRFWAVRRARTSCAWDRHVTPKARYSCGAPGNPPRRPTGDFLRARGRQLRAAGYPSQQLRGWRADFRRYRRTGHCAGPGATARARGCTTSRNAAPLRGPEGGKGAGRPVFRALYGRVPVSLGAGLSNDHLRSVRLIGQDIGHKRQACAVDRGSLGLPACWPSRVAGAPAAEISWLILVISPVPGGVPPRTFLPSALAPFAPVARWPRPTSLPQRGRRRSTDR